MDIDESYGLSGPPFDDEDDERNYIEASDDAGDACQYWDNVMEDRRISSR